MQFVWKFKGITTANQQSAIKIDINVNTKQNNQNCSAESLTPNTDLTCLNKLSSRQFLQQLKVAL